MKRRWYVVGAAWILSATIGCNAPEEGQVRQTEQPQIGIGLLDWRRVELTFANEKHLATILLIGDEAVGSYEKETEYWYVSTGGLEDLGVEDLEFSYTDGNGTPASESGDQEFTLPLYPTWNTFSSDPVSSGYRYDSGNRHVRFAVDSDVITRVTWYQTLSSGSPQNIVLDSEVEVGSGAVTVPSGQTGYYIDATIN